MKKTSLNLRLGKYPGTGCDHHRLKVTVNGLDCHARQEAGQHGEESEKSVKETGDTLYFRYFVWELTAGRLLPACSVATRTQEGPLPHGTARALYTLDKTATASP